MPCPPTSQRTAVDKLARESVLHAFSLGGETWALKADPNEPHFTVWEHPWRKFGGDDPRTTYPSAPVSPENTYRIRGVVDEPTHLRFHVYANRGGLNIPTATSVSTISPLDDDGRLKIAASRGTAAGGGRTGCSGRCSLRPGP